MHVLCLTNGDAADARDGPVRARELAAAADRLGRDGRGAGDGAGSVFATCLDDTFLRDGQSNSGGDAAAAAAAADAEAEAEEARRQEARRQRAGRGGAGDDHPHHLPSTPDPSVASLPWFPALVALRVAEAVSATRANAVLTFDARGASGHPDHIAAGRGCRWATRRVALRGGAGDGRVRPGTPVWLLMTPPPLLPWWVMRGAPPVSTYFGAATAAWQLARAIALTASGVPAVGVVSPPGGATAALGAMESHASQLVWFRWLYLSTSSLLLANVLVRAPV